MDNETTAREHSIGGAPLIVIEKIEYITNNHVSMEEVLFRLRRIETRVAQDTAAETVLAAQNKALREQLVELLSGNVLPPNVKEKITMLVARLAEERAALQAKVTELSPST